VQQPEPYLIFTRKLQSLRLRYMVGGSVAAIFYGEPRLTNDVDIIVFMRSKDVIRVVDAFPSGDFYCPPPEVIEAELGREQRGHFNLIHHETGFKADIYLSGCDKLHDWAYSRAVSADLEDDTIVFAPPEYVIVRKLQFFREGKAQKHLRDIQRMLMSLGDDWPRAALDELIQTYRLQAEWGQVGEHTEA